MEAHTVFLATGKLDMRGMTRPATDLSSIVAFKQYFLPAPDTKAALKGYVELMLFDGGYAGLEMVEEGKINLCLVASKAAFHANGKQWESLFAHFLAKNPCLAARMEGAVALWEKPLSIAGVPYGFVHRDAEDAPPNLYRLGDQMAVIPSFCGDGMSIALRTAHWAVEDYLLRDAAAYHARGRTLLLPNIRRASALARGMAHPLGQGALFHACRIAPFLLERANRLVHL